MSVARTGFTPIPVERMQDLRHLPSGELVGVIVSLNTRVFTTLAVVSAAHRLGIPLVIVECDSTDGSYETLSQLTLPVQSWIVRERKRIHGVMIDHLMLELNTTRVLLIDSDIEVRDDKAFIEMQAAMNQETVRPTVQAGRTETMTWLTMAYRKAGFRDARGYLCAF